MPDPEIYFHDVAQPIARQLSQSKDELLDQEVDAVTKDSLSEIWEADDNNALMKLFKLKFEETAFLFYRTGLGMQGQMDDVVVSTRNSLVTVITEHLQTTWAKGIKRKGKQNKGPTKARAADEV